MDERDRELVLWLGRAVRARREHRSLSRAALAARCGLSPRFLADVEAGRANISIVNLAHVARALETSAADLLRKPTLPSIALLGLRGAGKSTVGPELARRLGVPFVELDALVEARAGLALFDIFSVHGEALYRRLEAEAIDELFARDDPTVLATGGGVVTVRDTFERLKRACVTVWLRARPEDHMDRVIRQGDRRPIDAREDAMEDLRRILAARTPLYAEADLVVETTETEPFAVVERIETALHLAGHAA